MPHLTDTDITQWSTTAASNSPAGSDSIGHFLAHHFRNVKSVFRAESKNKQWVRYNHTINLPAPGSVIEVAGNHTSIYHAGRRIKVDFSGTTATLYGYIRSSSHSLGITSVTIDFDHGDTMATIPLEIMVGAHTTLGNNGTFGTHFQCGRQNSGGAVSEFTVTMPRAMPSTSYCVIVTIDQLAVAPSGTDLDYYVEIVSTTQFKVKFPTASTASRPYQWLAVY